MLKYERWVKAAGHSPGTIRLRLHYLNSLKAAYPDTSILELTDDQLAEFLAHPGWSPETRKSARCAIRSFYAWAYESDLVSRDPARRLPSVRIPRGQPRPTPKDIFTHALAEADQRGRLMLMFAGFEGLRRGEIARVHTDHIGDGELRVKGKGGVVRTIPLHPLVQQELAKIEQPGYLFPGKDEGHLSPGHVGVLLRRMLGPGWSGHTLRHLFATGFFNASKDILLTQQMLGHSKPETTARYVAVDRSAAAGYVASL